MEEVRAREGSGTESIDHKKAYCSVFEGIFGALGWAISKATLRKNGGSRIMSYAFPLGIEPAEAMSEREANINIVHGIAAV